MIRLIFLTLLIPQLCFGNAAFIHEVGSGVAASGCAGVYGNNGTTEETVGNGSYLLQISKVTLDCSATGGTVGVFTYYALNSSSYQITLVVYDSSGVLVDSYGPYQDTSASSPWYALQTFVSMETFDAGDYYVGYLKQATTGSLSRTSNAGGNSLFYTVTWNLGVPPASINIDSPDHSTDDDIQAFLEF